MGLLNIDLQQVAAGGKINLSNLKENQHTISLLHEAYRIGLLNHSEINDIQVQIIMILKDIIMRYTKGESSSVTYDIADSLLNSILYAIDAYTINCSSPEDAVYKLKTAPLIEIYCKGVEQVNHWFEDTKNLYEEIKKNKLNVQLESYNLTIQEAIPLFLKNYGIIFESHNTMASIDYPLVLDDTSVRGVLYIKNYLEHLKIEMEFCRYFSTHDIERLLSSFGRMIGMDYKIELINIFELVFNNAVFSILSGGIFKDLMISRYNFEILNKKLKPLTPAFISLNIEKAIRKLIDILNISEPCIIDYINRYKSIFIRRVINAAKNNSLGSIIIIEGEEKTKGSTSIFRNGERMSDDDFHSVINKLVKFKKSTDKISFIKSNITSLYDFIDMLNSDCLFGAEFEALFGTLSDMELSILAKIVFYEELRDNLINLSSVIMDTKDGNTEWQMRYIEFVRKLGENRIGLIENLLREIEYEEISFY